MDGLTIVVGLLIVAGLIGVVVPLLPGLPLVWAAVFLWACETQSTVGWVILGIATTMALAGVLLQFLVPGRRMTKAGVPASSAACGAALGIVGFFALPVVGGVVGFALGIYLAERIRLGTHAAAWPSTNEALKAIGLSVGIEFLAGLAVATTWLIGVAVSI
jgi:uncharacterized protein YqgC (DUF456 family)